MEPRKIVFVTPSLKTGGGNRVFVELANFLACDTSVYIVAPNNSADRHTFNLDSRITIKSIGEMASGKVGKVTNIFRTISYLNKYHRDDIVVCSDPLFCLFLGRIKAKNLYRFIQADDYRIFDDGAILGHGIFLKIFKRLTLRSYKNMRIKFIFNSKYTYEQFCKDSNRTDVSYAFVHPALNHNIFNNSFRTVVTAEDKLNICLVARKHPGKGIVNFINVWRDLDSQYKDKVGSVVLVSHDDLSCFDTTGMQILCPSCDEDITRAYCRADIFVSTSWREGFGLPPLEAMACGCAVLCSKAGGVDEYARERENCLMFEPRNEEQLKECLVCLIDDAQLRAELSPKGVATAVNFTWANSAQQLIRIIEQQ